jgi:AmmeMemoRadiSam system protein B
VDRRTAEQEHSIEMELPILKFIFDKRPFTIVPIIIGSRYPATEKSVTAALAPVLSDPRTL